MFFRFAAALCLVVLISMVGIGLEKQTLEIKRAVSRQYFQKDLLLELHAKHRLRIQQLTAPSLLTAGAEPSISASEHRPSIYADNSEHQPPEAQSGSEVRPRLPLLRWEHPVTGDR